MSQAHQLDAYQRPPEQMRSLFKKYQKCKAKNLHLDPDIINTNRASNEGNDQLSPSLKYRAGDRDRAFQQFLSIPFKECGKERAAAVPVFEVTSIPGLFICPDLLSPIIQLALLDRLLHRDLSNPNHRTNVHLHHNISYPSESSLMSVPSFFSQDQAIEFPPKNPAVHKPITTAEFLDKKLRWMTLGGQYDWTAKKYPPESPPPFPADIKQLLKSLFPDTDPQAAIVNFYSPGHTLGIHRDVSEYSDQGLVSISIGCDGLFIAGNHDGTKTATIRLRSGDALYMTASSRYAWHGVPQIIPDTCPNWLAQWPAINKNDIDYNNWRSWMYNKRINVNVRQMKETQSLD